MKDRHVLVSTLISPAPRRPWVDLLSQAAERLTPPEPDALDRDEAMATCQPWSVWVNGVRLRVVYESPAPEELPEISGRWGLDGPQGEILP
jgi:hypothetical protein